MDLYNDIAREGADHLFRRFRVFLPKRRRVQAKRRLHDNVRRAIVERRNTSSRHTDYLQALMEASTESGPIPDTDIINLSAGMVWAGHATIWGHLSWAL